MGCVHKELCFQVPEPKASQDRQDKKGIENITKLMMQMK